MQRESVRDGPEDYLDLLTMPTDSYLDLYNFACTPDTTEEEEVPKAMELATKSTGSSLELFNDVSASEAEKDNVYYEDTLGPCKKDATNDHVYYDDTLCPPKKDAQFLDTKSQNGLNGISQNSQFLSTFNETCNKGRNLPTPPSSPFPPPHASVPEHKDSTFKRRKGNDEECLKYYREEPTRRESLMLALAASDGNSSRSACSGCRCKFFVSSMVGLAVTAIYVGICYFIVRTVSAQLCGANVDNYDVKTILYGEVEYSNLNLTEGNKFETKFVDEVNDAWSSTILGLYLTNTTFLGFSQYSKPGRPICRFCMNLRLEPKLRSGIEAFTKLFLEEKIVRHSPGGATLLCMVVTTIREASSYACVNFQQSFALTSTATSSQKTDEEGHYSQSTSSQNVTLK